MGGEVVAELAALQSPEDALYSAGSVPWHGTNGKKRHVGRLVVLAFGAVALPIGLNPTWVEGVLYLTSAVLLALLCRLTFKYTILPSTRLQQLLKAYTALKVADANKATLQVARGPQRGIRVWKLLELHEHFQSVIADRFSALLESSSQQL